LPNWQNEPCWLPIEAAIAINKQEVERTGEPHVLLDRGKLESALERPRNLWLYQDEEDVAVLGAALLHGVAQAHAFLQGNKRTGFIACVDFIKAHGYVLTAPDNDQCADHVLGVVNRTVSIDATCQWLSRWVRLNRS
jgi:death on curing protein